MLDTESDPVIPKDPPEGQGGGGTGLATEETTDTPAKDPPEGQGGGTT
jgi:hypothetical protein